MSDKIQDRIDQLKTDTLPIEEVKRVALQGSMLVRIAAFESLVRRSNETDGVEELLVNAITDPINDVKFIGVIQVSTIALACLFRIGTEHAIEKGKQIIESYPEPRRGDVISFIESNENIDYSQL